MNKIHCALASAILLLYGSRYAQDEVNPVLKPPKGAQVAIVVFEDLECPDCRRAAPLVEEAAKTYRFLWCATIFPCHFTSGRSTRR